MFGRPVTANPSDNRTAYTEPPYANQFPRIAYKMALYTRRRFPFPYNQ